MNKFQVISFILYILIPVLFFIRMWTNQTTDLVKWILETILFGAYIGTIFLIGLWSMSLGHYTRYLLLSAFIVIAFISYRNAEKKFAFKRFNRSYIFLSFITLLVSGILMTELFLAFSASFSPPHSIDLEFPLKNGKFCIIHGGDNELVNHHYPVTAQKYALDIVQLNTLGYRASKANPKMLTDFYIFGSIVYSPCNGVVIDESDQFNDLAIGQMDPEHPAGNYLAIIKSDSKVVVILAHLMKGSLVVKKGDVVKQGQVLAKVGNSGNTTEPHLHIHSVLNQTGNFLFTGEGIPMKFQGKFLVRNDIMEDSSATLLN